MFIHTLTLFLCLSWTSFSFANSTITEQVTVTIDAIDNGGRQDQYRLKQQAVLLAKTRFPVLVEGVETLVDEKYSASIEAVSLLQATASLIQTKFTSDTNQFSGIVDVTLDVEASLSLLSKLKQNKALETMLSDYLVLIQDSLLATNRIDLALSRQKQIEAEQDILLSADLTTIYAVLSAKENALFAFRDELLTHYAESATWKVRTVDRANKRFTIRVSGPDMKQSYYELIKRYDKNNMTLLHGVGYLCGMSTLGVHFKADVFPIDEPGKPLVGNPIHTFEFDLVHDDNQIHIDQFNSTFKLLPCY